MKRIIITIIIILCSCISSKHTVYKHNSHGSIYEKYKKERKSKVKQTTEKLYKPNI